MRLRVQSGHEHDRCELHEQLGGIRVHSGLNVGGEIGLGLPRATDDLFFASREGACVLDSNLPGPRGEETRRRSSLARS